MSLKKLNQVKKRLAPDFHDALTEGYRDVLGGTRWVDVPVLTRNGTPTTVELRNYGDNISMIMPCRHYLGRVAAAKTYPPLF